MSGKKKAKLFIYNDLASKKVPTTGFEPARLLAPPPQDGMSTNFTTWAFRLQRYKKPINLSNKLFVVIQIFGKGFF